MEKLSSSKGLILSTVAGISVFIFTPFAEANATKAFEREQSYSYSSIKPSFDQAKEPTIDETAQYWNLNEEETEKFKKAIKEAYDQLPTKLKVMVGGVTGLETILITLEHYTGALEHGIYLGALKVTGSENAAWWVAKTIMLFVF
ncbi:hypothetical protein ABE037_18220 [Bacillus pumilus]|uniref:hypothetical protein n=1 Tax=Bacillus pumilus TaxID=1408 RepID=UPI002DB71F04|nr:hypothetical protein [Bacillus pumilus]MEC3593830.1 hypothetical protein [Bacillus pumilus]